MSEHITFYPQLAGAPMAWGAYHDLINNHILRHPSDWMLTDGGNGKPASFESDEPDHIQLRVEAQPGTIGDEDAAREWVEFQGETFEVVSVEPVTREGGAGFALAYGFKNPDGERLSGFVVLLNGTMIIETIFTWPGIGRLIVDAIFARDYPVVQMCVLISSSLFVFTNLVVDILYAYLDPRIRYQ